MDYEAASPGRDSIVDEGIDTTCCCSCNTLLTVPRHLVSQNKRRFQQMGYDLDLTYITPRIIVMGFPAIGVEHFFRNPRSEVVRFLDQFHKDQYKVFNFCSENGRNYSSSVFHGRVEKYPFEDHCVPEFSMIEKFTSSAQKWLNAHPRNIVALHCKAGKGRAGLMACTLLLKSGYSHSSKEAIEHYNDTRVVNNCGLTVVSQKKWVRYYEQILSSERNGKPIKQEFYHLKEVKLLHTKTGQQPPRLVLRVYKGEGPSKKLLFETHGETSFGMHIPMEGNYCLEFRKISSYGCRSSKYCRLWLSTSFIKTDTNGYATFGRDELDGVRRDTRYETFPAAFAIQLLVAPNRISDEIVNLEPCPERVISV